MLTYLLSTHSASVKDKGYEKYISWCLKVIQSHRKKNWVSTVHHVREIKCQTLKKKDSFWNNIPPGQCDPYSAQLVHKRPMAVSKDDQAIFPMHKAAHKTSLN